MRSKLAIKAAALAVMVMILGLRGEAHALPEIGARMPDALVADPDGRALHTRALRGRPALVLYEDPDSAGQNAKLKDKLVELARDTRYRASVGLAAIADVSRYASWPMRGFAEGVIRSKSREAGVSIYCDWDGGFRRTFGLHSGLSNVLLLAPDGRVLFAAAGPLRAEQQARLLALLDRELGLGEEGAER